MSKVNILGVDVHCVTMHQALTMFKGFLSGNRVNVIFTPNAEIMMEAQRNPELKKILNSADLLVADGAGVVMASKILKTPVPEKVAGFDLVKNSFSVKHNKKIRYFFFGGKPGVAETAAEKLQAEYDGIEISGCINGYFNNDEEGSIIERINGSKSDVLLVALGAPKQEYWIDRYRNVLNVKIVIGVGGSLDVFAGKAELAPSFFRNNNLEWLYRLYKEPWRFKRMLDLPRFIILAVLKRIKK